MTALSILIFTRIFILLHVFIQVSSSVSDEFPLVINTWPFVDANEKAAEVLTGGASPVDAVEKGCTVCEMEQCDHSVGFGGSPDESGETTLDAMIMDGETHDVGAVGCLRRVKNAISVARSVMDHTTHTLMVGDLATDFAVQMGFDTTNLSTDSSMEEWKKWKTKDCQPNFWNNDTVSPDPRYSCGPYHNKTQYGNEAREKTHVSSSPSVSSDNHDTIGMVAVDKDGRIACGTSTNGLTYKIPGRVGDSPIMGAGCYVQKGVGGAAATGDGDVMMRFLPSHRVVESMRRGVSPTDAAKEAVSEIGQYYPNYKGAIVAVNVSGSYGAAAHGFSKFKYTIYNPKLGKSTIIEI